jgi:hypothetical protein
VTHHHQDRILGSGDFHLAERFGKQRIGDPVARRIWNPTALPSSGGRLTSLRGKAVDRSARSGWLLSSIARMLVGLALAMACAWSVDRCMSSAIFAK